MRCHRESWVAHASRVLAKASSPSRTLLKRKACSEDFMLGKDCFAGTAEPARETRALPGGDLAYVLR